MKRGCKAGCASVVIVLSVAVFGIIHSVFLNWANPNTVRLLPKKQSKTLNELVELADGQFLRADDVAWKYRQLFFLNGLQYVDGRSEDGFVSFVFNSSNLEGNITLYYSPGGFKPVYRHLDRVLGFADRTLPDVSEAGIRIDGIGAGGKGYVFYSMISPEWYLVDLYMPT